MAFFVNFDLKTALRELYNKIMDTEVFNHAAQVAFYFSFSFFPLLFFLVTLFGIVLESTEGLRAELYNYLAQIMPPSAFDLVHATLDEVIENSSGGKLTIGLLVTLWSASAGVDSLRSSLNNVYELEESRSWFHTKLQSLVMTLMFILMLAFALAVVAAGSGFFRFALGQVGIDIDSPFVSGAIQWITIVLVMILTTAVIYSWVPNFEKFRWVWISPGAVVAIMLWILLTSGFRLYLQYFNSYNKTYGSLGAVIILMLWMYLTGMAILIGGAINSVLTEMSEGAQKEGTESSNNTDERLSDANQTGSA